MRLAMAAALLWAAPAAGATLAVGQGAAFPTIGAALQKARAGDTIRIGAGEYFECATISIPNLVLQGEGEASVITDTTCGGKALLVVVADGLVVRDLVLARARVPDMNGAGIRLEADGLRVERVVFRNNQVGILTAAAGPGEVHVVDCRFTGGGVAGERPAYALWVGAVARLVVANARFDGVKGGQIRTSAVQTELAGSRIETGVEPGAGYAVLQEAGTLAIRDTVIAAGPNPPPRDAAVLAMGEAVTLRGTRLENTTGQRLTLLLDWTHASPALGGNQVPPGDAEASSAGLLRHRVGGVVHSAIDDARAAAGTARRTVRGLLGR